jgi:hypothetical protein
LSFVAHARIHKQIVWAIYDWRTLVIMGDVLTNFDGELGEAVATVIQASSEGHRGIIWLSLG